MLPRADRTARRPGARPHDFVRPPGRRRRAPADGRTLACQWTPRLQVDKWRLLLLDVASGRAELITDGTSNDQVPNWSPDGRLISFMSDGEGSPAAIFFMNADGTGARRVGSVAPEHGVPFFSPDGSRVLASPIVDGGRKIWSLAVADGRHAVLSSCGT
jgi:Tol biopolymer transport system component